MRNLNKVATGIALALSLGFAASAFAHPGPMGGGMGPGAQGGPRHGGGYGMAYGGPGGPGRGAMHFGAQGGQPLMTQEERTAMREKMRAAATPEERQQIAAANHAEMQKRAKERGITLPEHRGPHGRGGFGPSVAPKPATPAWPAQ